jgi:phage-related protein
MAFETFTPPAGYKFSQGTVESHSPKILTASFGNGYSQEAGDGLNGDPAEVKGVWNVLTWAEGQTIMDFFKSKKGYIPFKFTLPGETKARVWKCKQWSRTWNTHMTVDISATLTEAFDPE